MAKQLWWERPPYTVGCPRSKCGARHAEPCRSPLGKVVAPHAERWTAADGDPIPGLELEEVL